MATRIIIAVPCADSASMKALTAHAIGSAIIDSEGLISDMTLRISCDIVANRTWLVKEAIKGKGTHILFVDCDMVFPAGAVKQLLSHGKEIVGTEYHKREFPLKNVSAPLEPWDGKLKRPTELYKAKYVGLGLTLIDLSIFEKMKGPWFNFGRDSEGGLVLGEDVWFCNTARDAGYDTWIDPKIKVYHLGDYAF